MSRAKNSALRVFAIPLAVGVASIVGLLLGLTGDGLRDAAAWLLVGLAPLTILSALMRRRPNTSQS